MINKCTRTYARPSKTKEDCAPSVGELPVEYENVCRLCLERQDVMIQIFSDHDCIVPVVSKIKTLLSLEVHEDDHLPPLICDNCMCLLDQGYNFKKRCLASDAKLRQCLVLPMKNNEKSEHLDTSKDDDLDLDYENESLILPKDECTIEWDDQVPLAAIISSDPVQQVPLAAIVPNAVISRIISEKQVREEVKAVDISEEDLTIPRGSSLKSYKVPSKNQSSVPNSSLAEEEVDDPEAVEGKEVPTNVTFTLVPHKSSEHIYKIKKDKTTFIELETMPLSLRLELLTKRQKEIVARSKRKSPGTKILGQYECSYCPKNFRSRSLLARHMRVHTGEKPFQCDECGSRFSQNEILQRHKAQIHSKNKPYQCRYCLKRFALMVLLNSHIKSAHMRTNSFECKVCGKSFQHSSGLSRHLSTHNGTIYYCKVCGKQFADGSSVKRHLKIHDVYISKQIKSNGKVK